MCIFEFPLIDKVTSMETKTVLEISEVRSNLVRSMRRKYPDSFITDCRSYSVRAYLDNDESLGNLDTLDEGTWPPKRAELDKLVADNPSVNNIWIEGRMDVYENLWQYNYGMDPNLDASEYWAIYLKFSGPERDEH